MSYFINSPFILTKNLITKLFTAAWICTYLSVISCSDDSKTTVSFKEKVNSPKDLANQSSEFEEQILKVGNNIYIAIGYGLANSILIEGDDGVVIIDCLESSKTASRVKEAFNKITSKPVKAIIYTHFHPDQQKKQKTASR